MNKTYFQRVHERTATRFWINNVTKEEAVRAIEAGAVGCTQNPSYTWKMIEKEDQTYVNSILKKIIAEYKDDTEALIYLQRELVTEVAKKFMPLYENTYGRTGYVSIQGDPFHEDMETIVRVARLNRRAAPNIMAKIPATPEGIKAIKILAAEKVPVNATECMAVRQVLDVCEAYEEATKDVDNPAPIYFSVITGIFDEYIREVAEKNDINVSSDALWYAGMSVAKKIYEIVKERKYACGYISGGARGLHHFTEMVGADACVTINWSGTADKLIEADQPVISRFNAPIPCSIVDELAEKIEDYRKAYFINAIKPEEYESFGPVVMFRSSFEEAWSNALKYIHDYRNGITSLGGKI